MKKYKVTFLLDKTNLWFEKYVKNHDFKLKKNKTQSPKGCFFTKIK